MAIMHGTVLTSQIDHPLDKTGESASNKVVSPDHPPRHFSPRTQPSTTISQPSDTSTAGATCVSCARELRGNGRSLLRSSIAPAKRLNGADRLNPQLDFEPRLLQTTTEISEQNQLVPL